MAVTKAPKDFYRMKAKPSRIEARELKQNGTPAHGGYHGKSEAIAELVEQCWGFYYADAHRDFEDAMRRLRKLSPYHSREIYNEISDNADAT